MGSLFDTPPASTATRTVSGADPTSATAAKPKTEPVEYVGLEHLRTLEFFDSMDASGSGGGSGYGGHGRGHNPSYRRSSSSQSSSRGRSREPASPRDGHRAPPPPPLPHNPPQLPFGTSYPHPDPEEILHRLGLAQSYGPPYPPPPPPPQHHSASHQVLSGTSNFDAHQLFQQWQASLTAPTASPSSLLPPTSHIRTSGLPGIPSLPTAHSQYPGPSALPQPSSPVSASSTGSSTRTAVTNAIIASLAPEEQAVIEEKRRRNTAASARFRLKKKARTLNMERTVSDLEGRTAELEREARDLRMENNFLKDLIMTRAHTRRGLRAAISGREQQAGASSPPDREGQSESDGEEGEDESGSDGEMDDPVNSRHGHSSGPPGPSRLRGPGS